MKELNLNEVKEVSGGHCFCRCSIQSTATPLVSSADECIGWCRSSNKGNMVSCDGAPGIHVECVIL